jgi:hypothetical protein
MQSQVGARTQMSILAPFTDDVPRNEMTTAWGPHATSTCTTLVVPPFFLVFFFGVKIDCRSHQHSSCHTAWFWLLKLTAEAAQTVLNKPSPRLSSVTYVSWMHAAHHAMLRGILFGAVRSS